MKPIFQPQLATEPAEGFGLRVVRGPGFKCPWHVHPEYELILVLAGKGYRIVGDNITSLGPGDLVLVGPGLPHIWQEELGKGTGRVHALVVQFEERFLGDGLLRLPALEPVRRLFLGSARGLHIVGSTRKRVSVLIVRLAKSNGFERILTFLEILGLLTNSKECHPIASPGFAADPEVFDQERMDRVFQFLSSRIDQDVRLSEAAQLVHLSEGAFSRFFRVHTGKTFPVFVNELRLGRVCRLLTETDKSITEAAFESGFTNLSNFNRQFRKSKGLSPREFRMQINARLPGAPSPHKRQEDRRANGGHY